MSSNAPHRNHYVPRMVQRNFVNERGGLFFWRRGMAIGQVRSTKPSNLFVEDNLYTIVDKEGKCDHSVELWFARLEALAAPFIQQVIKVVRHGLTPIMDPAHWDLWHIYNYHAQKRTVAWHTRFFTREDLFTVMQASSTEEQWNAHLKAWEADPENTLRELNNARIASQADPMPDDMLQEFRSKGLAIYVAPPRSSFILGDDMSANAMISSLRGQAATHRVEFMPIAPDVAVGYCDTRGVLVDHVDAKDVRRMNEAMARQSYLIAGRSEAQIASLSRVPYDPPDILEGFFDTRDAKTKL